MMKAVIIEDEANSRDLLAGLVVRYCTDVKVVDEAGDIDSGKEAIEKHQPDIVFLDIEMPGGSGFEVLEDVDDHNFEVIFTTAYDQYAIKAIKFSALDYLLKPINIKELKEAVERARTRIDQKSVKGRYEVLLENLNPDQNINQKKIILNSTKGSTIVKIKEIVRCEASGSYTTYFLASDEEILSTRPIGDAEQMLEGYGFFRVHKSHLVNLDCIRHFRKGSENIIVLEDDTEIRVSRRKKDALLNRLETM